jgi:hypothetical protein
MKKIFIILGMLMAGCIFVADCSAAHAKSLVYHAYAREGDDNVVGETFIETKELEDNQTSISRKKQVINCEINDEFIVDRDLSLISWRRVCSEDDTDYTSVREGDVLVVQGKINGEAIDKEIELGRKALHIYPKYTLSKFALSGTPKMKLWTMRRDEMKKLPMQAVNKGVKTIVVNGKEVEAIKVYYSITGKLREKYFNHNYYFRKSDGMFIKKEESNGRIEELVKEK